MKYVCRKGYFPTTHATAQPAGVPELTILNAVKYGEIPKQLARQIRHIAVIHAQATAASSVPAVQ